MELILFFKFSLRCSFGFASVVCVCTCMCNPRVPGILTEASTDQSAIIMMGLGEMWWLIKCWNLKYQEEKLSSPSYATTKSSGSQLHHVMLTGTSHSLPIFLGWDSMRSHMISPLQKGAMDEGCDSSSRFGNHFLKGIFYQYYGTTWEIEFVMVVMNPIAAYNSLPIFGRGNWVIQKSKKVHLTGCCHIFIFTFPT